MALLHRSGEFIEKGNLAEVSPEPSWRKAASPRQCQVLARRSGRRRALLTSRRSRARLPIRRAGHGCARWGDASPSPGRSAPGEPFRNRAQEFFADGMTDELISCLMTIGALRVASRTSVMRYRDTQKPLPQIARELQVGWIVQGSVLQSGSRVRITAHLIEAATDRQLWGGTYEKDVAEVLSLQSAVARRSHGGKCDAHVGRTVIDCHDTPSRSRGLRRLPAGAPLLEQADPRRPGSGGRLLPPRD